MSHHFVAAILPVLKALLKTLLLKNPARLTFLPFESQFGHVLKENPEYSVKMWTQTPRCRIVGVGQHRATLF